MKKSLNLFFGGEMNQEKWAALKKIKQHRNNYKLLGSCLNLIPSEVRRLFLNVKSVVYVPKNRRHYDGSAIIPLFGRSSIWVYPLAFQYPKKKRRRVKDYVLTMLMHEVAHTLDFTDHGLGTVPYKIHEGISQEEWQEALAAEPESPEDFIGSSKSFRRYNRKPEEQWAIRMALVIISEYLAPAGLISKKNICRTPRTLSVAEFKGRWPKGYRFFHKYIKRILAQGLKN